MEPVKGGHSQAFHGLSPQRQPLQRTDLTMRHNFRDATINQMMRAYSETRRWMARIASAFALALLLQPALGLGLAQACQENAMLVFDASGSMARIHDGLPKIETAREAAGEVLPDVTRRRPTGLVTYGGEPGPSCGDVHLKLPPMVESGDLILAELALMQPNGQTPLSDAVLLAAETLRGLGKPGVIVLVTDGLENCGYNACLIGQKLRLQAPDIRVHVIGFHLKQGSESHISCLAGATGGTYTSTNSLASLRAALHETLSCPRISWNRKPLSTPRMTRLAGVATGGLIAK